MKLVFSRKSARSLWPMVAWTGSGAYLSFAHLVLQLLVSLWDATSAAHRIKQVSMEYSFTVLMDFLQKKLSSLQITLGNSYWPWQSSSPQEYHRWIQSLFDYQSRYMGTSKRLHWIPRSCCFSNSPPRRSAEDTSSDCVRIWHIGGAQFDVYGARCSQVWFHFDAMKGSGT